MRVQGARSGWKQSHTCLLVAVRSWRRTAPVEGHLLKVLGLRVQGLGLRF